MKNIIIISLALAFISCNADEEKKTKKTPTPNLKTVEALSYCKENNMNTNFCILVEMGTHSGIERMIVWDFKNDSIIE